MRKWLRTRSTGTGPLLAVVAVLAALVAAYGAFVLPRVATTTAREAAPADASPAVLVSASEAGGTWSGCPWSHEDASKPTIELRAVT
jgi:hypothetical protein